MSYKIDPREVLIYLNKLGYTNISAQQLKEFIIDLKKIIKYEQRKHKTLGHDFGISDTYNYSTPIYPEPKLKPQMYQNNDIFEMLHNHPTQASKAKMVDKINGQIAVHITHAKKKNIDHEHCVHLETGVQSNICNCRKPSENVQTTSSERVSKEDIQTQTDRSKQMSGSSTNKSRPTSNEASSVPSSKLRKSKTAVLKNTSSVKSLKKSDPVALYHQYQQEWKSVKFPGEDNHLDLRWAVREKLINGPPVEIPLKKRSHKKNVF
ncbi:uncharacterized protein LOC130901262 [Diorhabda carinulata]|uniref:uncharacterized protein LOC130901262 n=1 Tax=Diorhabda carinulata TaxID=1163345 RepID=UPI0025A0106B|nr:uncharacterized protein LOC130901262 [Diorhabda carinulata]